MAKKKDYGNDSITMLKGADKVRKRPAVIFGSDGLDGCEHSVFEIISNSIDEARAGYGNKIIITHYLNNNIEVEDFGRGCPVDFNNNEQRFNWELVYCELYAGGKYDDSADSYEFSLGLNGLGLCATQFASEFMDVEVIRDGYKYNLHFEKGENIGGLHKEPCQKKQTGTKTLWRPDLDVFTDINISDEFFFDILKRQAVVNPDILFLFRSENEEGGFDETVIPVRGKILNCLKAEYAKIFKSEIITDLIKVLGCGVEVTAKANKELSTFDINNFRWNKIVICTDADVDGFQIRTLILTMLYRLTPTLIEQGYVFIAESPLFEINTKDKTYFAYTEQEKQHIIKKIGNKKYTIQRSKGLGENEPDMMNLTTMNPDTRRLIKVTADDIRESAEIFEMLLGDDLQGRKNYISEYGADYLELADIS